MENKFSFFSNVDIINLDDYHSNDNIFNIKLLNVNTDIKKYEYLEELFIRYYVTEDIDLSNFDNLKKLTINVRNNINITLPNSLEELIVYCSVSEEYNINLINYEKLKYIYCDFGAKISNNLNECYNLKRLVILNIDNMRDINLNNCKDLYFINLSSYIYNSINLENCDKLKYINLEVANNENKIIITLPKGSKSLKTLSIYTFEEIDKYIINNLYDNINIEDLRISLNLYFDKFPNLKKLSAIDFQGKEQILNISKNFNLEFLEILSCNIKYVDLPYNFKGALKTNSEYNNFSKQKVISRRRIYLLCESKVGTRNGLAETPPKGHVEDVCESKVGTRFGLSEILNNTKCYRCKKNINLENKINIRNEGLCSYISCC